MMLNDLSFKLSVNVLIILDAVEISTTNFGRVRPNFFGNDWRRLNYSNQTSLP